MKRPGFHNLTFDASPELALAIRKRRESNLNLTDSDVCRAVLMASIYNDAILDDAYKMKETLFADVSQERFSRSKRNISFCFRVSEINVDRVDTAVVISDYPSRSVFLYCLFSAYFNRSHANKA